jgi:hypothetical protein
VGFAHADGVLDEGFRRALLHEVRAGPFRQMAGTFGKASVRMEIDGYDLAAPFEGFPRVLELAEVVAARVHAEGEGIRGLATWRPNEAGVGLYAPGSLGITSHLDGRWYRRLVIVFTLAGSARFVVRASREGEILEAWDARAGGVTFMRGPGLAGARDGRPFHSVAGPRGAIRCSLAFRMRIGRSQE